MPTYACLLRIYHPFWYLVALMPPTAYQLCRAIRMCSSAQLLHVCGALLSVLASEQASAQLGVAVTANAAVARL